MKIILFVLVLSRVSCRSVGVVNEDAVNEEPEKRIIFPGTLWCGMGSNAENDNQLGTYADVDSCCRTHDKCGRRVKGFSKNYGYRNWRPFTVSDCVCDMKLYKCLKSARNNPNAAKIVGKVFFNALKMPCLQFKSGETAQKGRSPSYR